MRRSVGRAAARTAIAAFAAAIPVTLALAVLNGRWVFWSLPVLAIEITVLLAIVLAAPLILHSIVAGIAGRPPGAAQTYALAAAALFALAWVGRLKPSHQPLASKAHLSGIGAIELLLIAAAAAVVFAAGAGGSRSRWRRITTIAFAILMCSASLTAFAWMVEPRRQREVTSDARSSAVSQIGSAPTPRRVLVIGIDGLDWRALQYLASRGQLPTLAGLVQRGRTYQLDARGVAVSPPIWTAIYTGFSDRRNMIGGYTEWQFVGLRRPIWFFPEFGAHPALMLDTLLDATESIGLWRGRPTTSRNIQDPPIWELASAAGRRVGVFDPAPFPVVGEEVNGSFAWRRDDRYVVERGGQKPESNDYPATMPTMFADTTEMLRAERERIDVAERTIGPDQDLAIYYTPLIDWLGHRHWDAIDAFDPAFARTPIADGYRVIDAMAARLVARFGPPAIVAIVSDHGWEFSEYEHFLGPNGVLVISGAGATGYGGTSDVLAVAPTVLSLLGLPVGDDMQPPLGDVTGGRRAASYGHVRHARFVSTPIPHDRERVDLLRTLGYVAR